MTNCRNCGRQFIGPAPVYGIVAVRTGQRVSELTGEKYDLVREEFAHFCSLDEAHTWQKRSPKTFVRWVESNVLLS